MSDNTSPFLTMQRVETQVKVVLRAMDPALLEPAEKQAVAAIRRLLVDARLDIRDYELSETRDEQLQNAHEAKQRLGKLQAAVLRAGGVFSPADVAHLSAQLEQINGWLE